ncbi:hypothetical protein ACIO6T_45105 [Streptomyces sp. NPDC087532]|uniref:hypothetical protein n=1 Tax=unclassified Streptomyces TaxID=2593676 RepID=UPI003327D6AB
MGSSSGRICVDPLAYWQQNSTGSLKLTAISVHAFRTTTYGTFVSSGGSAGTAGRGRSDTNGAYQAAGAGTGSGRRNFPTGDIRPPRARDARTGTDFDPDGGEDAPEEHRA